MAKDKKSKRATAPKRKAAAASKTATALKSAAANPLVQEVVAAALVATAAALKDAKKARAMAEDAGDQLGEMAKEGSLKGKALWALALEVADRAGDILTQSQKVKKARPAKKAKKKA